jgi:hypothetical protein
MSPKLFAELTNRHGFVVIMYPNDHRPAHVHVYHGDKLARVNFEPEGLEIMDNAGFRSRDLKNILELLQPYREQLIELWNEIHPDIPFKQEE